MFAERLLEERVPVPCRFADHGCNEELLLRFLTKHERECPRKPTLCANDGCSLTTSRAEANVHAAKCEYRTSECPIESCGIKVVYRSLGAHIERKHLRRQLFPLDLEFAGGKRLAAATVVMVLSVVLFLVYQLFVLDDNKNSMRFEL